MRRCSSRAARSTNSSRSRAGCSLRPWSARPTSRRSRARSPAPSRPSCRPSTPTRATSRIPGPRPRPKPERAMAPSNSRPIVRRTLVAAGALALATAGIGVLHMPFARSLLMRVGGCPMAGARMTPREMEHARHIALEDERAPLAAPVRPSVGFALDTTSLAEVHAWADRAKVGCEDKHPGLVLCTNVQPASVGLPAAEGVIDELALGFNERNLLVNETTMRMHLTPEGAERTAHAIVGALRGKLGAGKSLGDFGARHLSGPTAESIATVTYRYADYVADVSAMNSPHSGLLIR